MRITENRMILFSFDFQDEISYDVFTSSPSFIVFGSNSAFSNSGCKSVILLCSFYFHSGIFLLKKLWIIIHN